MIRFMCRSFVLLVLLTTTLVAGVFVGHHVPGVLPGPSPQEHPTLVLRDALAEVGELVLVERHVHQSVTRELSGYLGSQVVRVDAVGVQRLGIDLSRARVVDVDHDARVVTIALADAGGAGMQVLHAGLDPDTTFITAHETGLWPLSLAPSPEADLVAAALRDASAGLLVAADDLLDGSDLNARINAALGPVLEGSGWSIRVAPIPHAGGCGDSASA